MATSGISDAPWHQLHNVPKHILTYGNRLSPESVGPDGELDEDLDTTEAAPAPEVTGSAAVDDMGESGNILAKAADDASDQ